MASRLKWLVPGDSAPNPADWQRMGRALMEGDPLADALVEWMHQQGKAKAWAQFERALQAPPADLLAFAEPLRTFLLSARSMPSWVNWQQIEAGATVLRSTGLHGMRVLRDAGLMAGYQASAINQTLLMTGALHKGAQRRVAETTSWWLDCVAPEGMQRGAPGFNATLRVRLVHAWVRRQLSQSPRWDVERWGVPVNQQDMQATYLAFSVVQLIALKTTGFWLTRAESEAVMHFWRYVGWLMGVDEQYLCDNETQGRRMLYQNVLGQAPSDETSVQLGQALMDEPLYRRYARWKGIRGRFNRAMHLSLVRWFVGREGMRNLGLPPSWPWYPLLMWVPNVTMATLWHWAPFARKIRAKLAGRQQRAYLQVLMGENASPHLHQEALLDRTEGS